MNILFLYKAVYITEYFETIQGFSQFDSKLRLEENRLILRPLSRRRFLNDSLVVPAHHKKNQLL
jgi:hypothetical protein